MNSKKCTKRHHSKGRNNAIHFCTCQSSWCEDFPPRSQNSTQFICQSSGWLRQIKWTRNAINLQARKRNKFLYLLVFLLWRLSTTVMSTSGLLFRDFFSDWNRNCKSYTLLKKRINSNSAAKFHLITFLEGLFHIRPEKDTGLFITCLQCILFFFKMCSFCQSATRSNHRGIWEGIGCKVISEERLLKIWLNFAQFLILAPETFHSLHKKI